MQQYQKQQEALHELQLRMEAIEAHQRRSWTQSLWRGGMEPAGLALASDGPSLVLEDPAADPLKASADDVVQSRSVRSYFSLEWVTGLFDIWDESSE